MHSIVKEPSHAVWIVFAIYGLSFCVPALGPDFYGWHAFVLGLIYCWALPWTIAWWANVLFWIGLGALSIHAYGKAAAFGLIAFLLGLSFLCTTDKYQPQVGYYLWIGSMVGLLATALGKAGQAEVEKSQLLSLARNRSSGPEPVYFRHDPCERIAPGPPPTRLADHIREGSHS